MLCDCEGSGVGYDVLKTTGERGRLGEAGAELNSDERSVRVLQSESLSNMFAKSDAQDQTLRFKGSAAQTYRYC